MCFTQGSQVKGLATFCLSVLCWIYPSLAFPGEDWKVPAKPRGSTHQGDRGWFPIEKIPSTWKQEGCWPILPRSLAPAVNGV